MSNTLGGLSLAAIAQQSVEALAYALAPLNGCLLDLSNEVVLGATSITTRIPTVPTAATLTSFSPSDVVSTAVTLTLPANPIGFVAGFTDAERNASVIPLERLFIEPMIEGLARKIMGDIWALFTAGNFSSSYVSTAANWDRSDLADVATTLTSTLNAPTRGRTAWMSPAFFASLVKSQYSAEFPGNPPEKTEGSIARTAGFDSYPVQACATANGANEAAVCFHKSAVVFAARRVSAQAAPGNVFEQTEAEIPGLGIPVTFRSWYSPDNGQFRVAVWLHYAVAKGQNTAVRIVTA